MRGVCSRNCARRLLITLLACLVAACTPTVPPPTPGPPVPTPALPSSPAPPSEASPTNATPTTAPTTAPTSATAPTGAPSPGAGWEYISGFPAGAALAVSAVSAIDEGYLAVGAEPAAGESVDGIRQGVIWSSLDGWQWQRETSPDLYGASLDHVAVLNGEAYIFGFLSTCPAFDDGCPDIELAGNAAWRGTPATGWRRLELPEELRTAAIDGVAVALDRLLVRTTVGDEVVATLWRTADGEEWQSATDIAEMDYLAEVVAGGAGLVVLGARYDFTREVIETRIAHSSDGQAFAEAQLPAELAVAIAGAADGPAGLVAIGNVVSDETAGAGVVVLRSSDGEAWAAERPTELASTTVAALHPTQTGYLAMGTITLDPTGGQQGGLVWWSSDGQVWQLVDALDEATFNELSASASGAAGAVVFAVQLSDERSVIHAWRGPAQPPATP